MKKLLLLALVLLLIGCTSCKKEETPVTEVESSSPECITLDTVGQYIVMYNTDDISNTFKVDEYHPKIRIYFYDDYICIYVDTILDYPVSAGVTERYYFSKYCPFIITHD